MGKKKNQRRKPAGGNTKKNNRGRNIGAIALVAILIGALMMMIFQPAPQPERTGSNPAGEQSGDPYKFRMDGELAFLSEEGDTISTIEIEIAEDHESRMRGMMYRTAMKENRGMFFVFPYEGPQSFWMKNTPLALDMLFINKRFEIVKIHENTAPYSTQSYPSDRPATYVLEVNAGYCGKYGIEQGDKVAVQRIPTL